METFGNDLFVSQHCTGLKIYSTFASSLGSDLRNGAKVRSMRGKSVHSNAVLMQRQGVHYFFEFDSQQQHLGSGNWLWAGNRGSNDDAQQFYSGADEANARNLILKRENYGVNAQMNNFGNAPAHPEVANADFGIASMHSIIPTVGDSVDNGNSSQMMLGSRQPQDIASSVVVKSQPNNQPLNTLGQLQNNQHKASHPMTISSTFLHQSNQIHVGALNGQVQDQNTRFLSQTLQGEATLETPNHEIPGNQILWKGHVPGAFQQQVGSSRRSVGHPDVQQSLHSQEHLLAQQLKMHSEQSKQQEVSMQFPGNSFSALLHGHDRLSPQAQPLPQPFHVNGGTPAMESGSNNAAFPAANLASANTETPNWPSNGLPYHQGLTYDFLMGQDPNVAWQSLASKGFEVDHSFFVGNVRDRVAFYPDTQNLFPDHLSGGLKLSNSHVGKPVHWIFSPGNAPIPEAQTDVFGLSNGLNNEVENRYQLYAKRFSGQNLQHFNVQSMNRNQMGNNLHQTNLSSKSQNQLQNFQVSQPRNWGSQGTHIESQSLEATEALPQIMAKPHDSNLPWQNVNNFETRSIKAVPTQFLQQGSYQPGNCEPAGVVGLQQQRCCSTPPIGTSMEHTDNVNCGQHVGSWSSLTHQIHSGSVDRLQLFPNLKHNIWGTNCSQDGNSLVGNSTHSFDAFDNRQIQRTQQHTPRHGRDSPATLAEGTFWPDQNSSHLVDLRARQESFWKGNDRVIGTVHKLQPSLEPDVSSQRTWKNCTPPVQSPAAAETTCQSEVDGHCSNWIHKHQQGNVEIEAPYRMKLAPRKPNTANRQDFQNREQTHERLVTCNDLGRQQSPSQDCWNHCENQGANFIGTIGEQDNEVVSDLRQGLETPFYQQRVESDAHNALFETDVDLAAKNSSHPHNNFLMIGKNFSTERQRELSEQSDVNASSVSLAHFRHNQSSNTLSPQSIRLGLGPPSNSFQNLYHSNAKESSSFSRVQRLDGEMPSANTLGKDPGYSSHCSLPVSCDINDADPEGGNMVAYVRVSQGPAVSSSVQTSNNPSFISKESRLVEPRPPASVASGPSFRSVVREDAHVVAPQFMISFEKGQGALSSQRESDPERRFLSSAVQAHTNATSGGYIQEKSTADFIAQPSFLHDNPTHPVHDGGGTHIMQDECMMNATMQQLGGRAQVANFSGLPATFKVSLSEQSNYLAGHERDFSGVFESLHSSSGGSQRDRPEMAGEPQTNLRKRMNSGIVSGEGLSLAGTGSHERSDPFKFQQEKPLNTLEASMSTTTSFQTKLQGQNSGLTPASLSHNGGSLQADWSGHNQGQNKGSNHFSPLKDSISMPMRSTGLLQGSNRATLDKFLPVYSIQGQSVQHHSETTSEALSLRQTSDVLLHSDAPAAFFSELAVSGRGKLNESVKKVPKSESRYGILGTSKANVKGIMDQQAPRALAAVGQSELKPMWQQNVFPMDDPIQSNLQASDNLPLVHAQLPNQAPNNFVVGASLASCLIKGTNSTRSVAEASCASVGYFSSSTGDELLAPQASIFHNLSAGGKTLVLSEQLLGKNLCQPVSHGDPSSCNPVGMVGSVFKDVESRLFVRNAGTPDQIYQRHFSPLQSKFQVPVTVHPKKRRKLVPPLIPWHVAATQPRGQLLSTREANLMWANAANHLSEKDDGETHDDATSTVSRAKRRLKLTTQSMQQLIPPLPGALICGSRTVDNECATYHLAKLLLGDACRLIAGCEKEADSVGNGTDNKGIRSSRASHGQGGTWNVAVAVPRLVESFMESVKRLDGELTRLECSSSALELKGETHDLEEVSIVNRLARHHGPSFFFHSSEIISLDNIYDFSPGLRRLPPKKYVSAVPMPRTLPEGVRCLSL